MSELELNPYNNSFLGKLYSLNRIYAYQVYANKFDIIYDGNNKEIEFVDLKNDEPVFVLEIHGLKYYSDKEYYSWIRILQNNIIGFVAVTHNKDKGLNFETYFKPWKP